MPRQSGAFISFGVTGVEKIREVFRAHQRRMEGRRGTLNVVGQYLSERFKQSFTKQADPATGSAWAPLAPSTVKEKRAKGYSKKALIRTSQMKNSIGYAITGSDRVFAGAADKKAVWHQEGTVGGGAASARSGGGRVGVPARPIVGMNARFEAQIQKFVTDWIQGRRI